MKNIHTRTFWKLKNCKTVRLRLNCIYAISQSLYVYLLYICFNAYLYPRKELQIIRLPLNFYFVQILPQSSCLASPCISSYIRHSQPEILYPTAPCTTVDMILIFSFFTCLLKRSDVSIKAQKECFSFSNLVNLINDS